MEQRLAEFREARKRAGLAAEPSTSRQSAQTSGEKAEATATPESAPGWLKRFLVWKRRPASAPAQPSLAQVRGGRPRRGPGFGAAVVAPLETRAEARPFHHVVAFRPRPREEQARGGGAAPPTHPGPQATPPLGSPGPSLEGAGLQAPPTCSGLGLGLCHPSDKWI